MIKNLKTNKKLYFSLFKAVLPGVLFLIVLFSMFFISNNDKVITSLTKVFYGDNEVELDNWEISTVFYDSTVNDGKTPLTEINWDASDGSYKTGETRTINVHIIIKNSNVSNNYEANSVSISIKNLFYGEVYHPSSGNNRTIRVGDYSDFIASSNITVGANDSTHEGYKWNFNTAAKPYARYEYLSFSNSELIEKNTNFEDTINIEYIVTPDAESAYEDSYSAVEKIEFGEDSCKHVYDNQVKAVLSYTNNSEEDIYSNALSLHYERTYYHPWGRNSYDMEASSEKISSYDGLGPNPSDYIWVKYFVLANSLRGTNNNQSYPNYSIYYENAFVKDILPSECVVYDSFGNKLDYSDNGYNISVNYDIVKGSYVKYALFYVGYPKSIYNGDNLNISNKLELWGKYDDRDYSEQVATSNLSLNLSDYVYNFEGALYNIKKTVRYSSRMTNLDIENDWGSSSNWYIAPTSIYNGKKYDYIIGDDYLYYELNDGQMRKLDDNEYYFKVINLNTNLLNSNGNKLAKGKYDCELWVRKKGEASYKLEKEFKNGEEAYYTFEKSVGVVGFYIKIKDLQEGVSPSDLSYSNYIVSATTAYNISNITETGKIYNSAYLKIIVDDELKNASSIEGYYNDFEKENLSTFDLDNNGFYLQRSTHYDTWEKTSISQPSSTITAIKGVSKSITQNAENEDFVGEFSISARIEHFINFDSHYSKYYDLDYGIYGFDIYDLLPEGMELNSSTQEIKNSVVLYNYSAGVYSQDTVIYDKSFSRQLTSNEIIDLFKDGTTVDIKKNWKNSGRTWLHIHVKLDDPIYGFKRSGGMAFLSPIYTYKYKVPYDSVVEYGKTWNNTVFVSNIPENKKTTYSGSGSYIYDNGTYDPDIVDIDEDGIEGEYYKSNSASTEISSIISTHQAVQVQVKTDNDNYEVGKVSSSLLSNYEYKLKVTTGTNDVTNLVIYDSLEKYAKDSNMSNILASGGRGSWQGEFLGVDTSYAESKGFNVRIYYSENEEVSGLKDDTSWKLYTEDVDKSKVKSLAFEYLDGDGNSAVLPANSLTYVLIKMKSPADEEIKTLAYNGCWTEWNAIDPLTNQTVDFITGINSNIVKVALPNSVEPVDIDLNIDKYWVDNNNQNFRPDTINIQVVPNGDVTKAIDVPLGSTNIDPTNPLHWSTTVSVPKYDYDGNLINYTLREDEIILEDGYKYTPTIEDNTITNTLMKEIELKKIWKDNDNGYLTRPNNVTYMVKQNGNDYKEVTFTGDYSTNIWTKKITVPVFDSTNNEYTYTVEEVNIDNYSSNCEELICTNTLAGNKNINITKEWNDKDNEYSTRPDNITVNLLRNGTLFKEVNIDNTNWMSNSIEIPIYDNEGVKYNYTISENNIDEYGLVEYDQVNFKVINTLKKRINLVIKKIWVDDNNSNNTRPDELTITLLRDNEEYQTLTLSGDTNEWTTTVEVDKYDNNLNKYKYSIREVNDSISDLYSNVTYSEDELTVTNTLSQNTSLTISKKWIDHNNEYLTRPDSIKVNLLQNDSVYREITLSKDKNWKEEVTDIPVYDSNQNKYTYTIEESVNIPKYGKITYDQTNFEITNELTEVPTVSLYFTVVNGYIDPVTGEMKYDDFGLNEILKKYDKTIDDEYIFTFELKNLDSGNLYDGKLSTQGILEFKDIPYGDYKAVEGEDNLFDFVDMLSIEEVNGVRFRRVGNEGYISIRPTGEDIVFGAKIVNKITAPIDNPNTGVIIEMIILLSLLLPISYSLYLLSKTIKSQ